MLENGTQPKVELERLMRAHEITVEIRPEGYAVDDAGWEHMAYRFALSIGGKPLASSAVDHEPLDPEDSYRAGMALDEPEPVDVFGSVLADCSMVEGREDWLDFAEEFDLLSDAKSARKARDDFRTMQTRATLIRERVGEDAFVELLEVAGEL